MYGRSNTVATMTRNRAIFFALNQAAKLLLLSAMAMFASASYAATTVSVSTSSELANAVQQANSQGGDFAIMLQDGTYTLTDTLYINADKVALEGASGNRNSVTIQGDAMSAGAQVGNLIRVAASDFSLRHITLRRSGYHLVQIAGETNADNPVFQDCVFQDAYEQMLKVSIDENAPSVTSDNGVVENCLFEYTAGIAPQYYVGGIDAHGAKNWVIRGNTFKSIISPSVSVAEFAVHFWNGSANNLVERNSIIDCDRGIGFGLEGRGNSGGIIRNNMIYSSASNAGQFADAGIVLTDSSGTDVLNNSVFIEHGFPWAIEYRFATSNGIEVRNNLTNKAIQSRDGGSAALSDNITNASSNWFQDIDSGDLHLSSGALPPINSGQALSGLTDDFDGEARPQSGSIDVGADEYSDTVSITPSPPTDLRVD